MDEALLIATAVVGVAALVIMLSLPNRGIESSEGSDSSDDVE
jgi:multisubunit Na+/H+ antiporter MnhC subunit